MVGENLQSNLPIILLEDLFQTFLDNRSNSASSTLIIFILLLSQLFHLLFGHGDAGSLIHPHVGDPHAAEDGEGLQEVLIVGGEVRAGAVHLVDTQLS